MWKIAEFAEGKSRSENVVLIKDMLENLKNTISQIKEFEVGINFNESDTAYDAVLYSTFDSKDHLDTYQNHPDHKKCAAYIAKVRTARVVADYEV
jgi:hypothetical protein